MKVNSFVISLGLILALILAATFGIWKNSPSISPINLDSKNLEVTASGSYLPRDAYLTIHFNLDANKIPNYIASFSEQSNRSLAIKDGKAFRDGLFALIGLDFEEDLSNWITSRFSISILNGKEGTEQSGWIFAIEGINNDETQNFLTSYWEKQTNNGAEVQKEEFEGQYIILEKPNDPENDNKIAMSILENNVLLISSSKKVMEETIETSKNRVKTQIADEEIKDTIRHLDDGSILITSSSEALQNFFQIPQLVVEKIIPSGFAASIRLDNKRFFLDSYIKFDEKFESMKLNNPINLIKEKYISSDLNDIAIINNPKKLLDKDSTDIYSKWIGDLFSKSLIDIKSKIVNKIVKLEGNNLILGSKGKSWLIGVESDNQIKSINTDLEEQNFNKSNLKIEDKDIIVWSKIITKEERGHYKLLPNIALIQYCEPTFALVTNEISLLDKINSPEELGNEMDKVPQIDLKQDIEITQHISLGEDSSNRILNNWKPWQIIKSVTGRGSKIKAKNLKLEFGEDNQNEQSALSLRAMLSIN